MALEVPLFLTQKGYDPDDDRQMIQLAGHMKSGIVGLGHYAPTAGSSTSVNVAAGLAVVKGTTRTLQGSYLVVNNATTNVTLPLSWAPSGQRRIDQVFLAISDQFEAAGNNTALFTVLNGSPGSSGSVSLANRSGASTSYPASSVRICDVQVSDSATGVITVGNPGDPFGAALAPSIAGAPPQYVLGRPADYVPFCRAYNSGANSVPGATNDVHSPISFNSEQWDNDGMRSGTSQFVTIKTPGIYSIKGYIEWPGDQGGGAYRAIGVRINGSLVQINQVEQTTNVHSTAQEISFEYRMAYGDTLELTAAKSSTSSITVNNVSPRAPAISALWVGP